MNERMGKLKKNTVSSLIFQVTTVICGFILPRMIMKYYGSEVNGLVSSITQFIGFISLLELGMGAVVQSNLYKPIAENNVNKINEIMTSANNFFRLIGKILFVYIVLLILMYPLIVIDQFDKFFTVTLILAISISAFAQYYFGVVDRIFLTSAQLGYIQYNAQTITLILNTVLCCVFMKLGASIQIVKLTTSIIYVARPVFIRFYINKKFHINRNVKYDEEPIKQKWNGIAQHVACVVNGQTDTIVLTMFSTLSSVSIYSVYNLITKGVNSIIYSLFSGIDSLLGEVWAKNEKQNFEKYFDFYQWAVHSLVFLFFGCTMVLILPFVEVYTNGIDDVNYIIKSFAILFVIDKAISCLKLPYLTMINVSGKYKETQNIYIITAVMNIIISVFLVKSYGLLGVAIGTFVASIYQYIGLERFTTKHLIQVPIKTSLKQWGVDLLNLICGLTISMHIELHAVNYSAWLFMAIKIFAIWIIITICVNRYFYKENLESVYLKLKKSIGLSK